jgi:hypothetical protein
MASAAILKRIAAVVKTPTADKMPARNEKFGLSKFVFSIISRDLLREKACVAINPLNRLDLNLLTI